MQIVFSGDRKSKVVKVGRWFKRFFKETIVISLWDGYKGKIYIKQS